MRDRIQFRPARATDAELLLAWRNDVATRAASRGTAEVTAGEHSAWLAARLADPTVDLLIAEVEGIPIGTVRCEHDDGSGELSWTLAPSSRGRGLGSALLLGAVERYRDMTLWAVIHCDNLASRRMAQRAGFRCQGTDGPWTHWVREAGS